MREELEKQDKSEMKVVTLLPILGTLVREGGNGMEEALARIRTIRGRTNLQYSSILRFPRIVVSWYLLYSALEVLHSHLM